MCIEFQHLTYQVVVIKGLAYLLTYFIAVVIAAVALKLKDWLTLAFTGKIYFHILGLGRGSVALVLHVSGLGLGLLALTPLALLTSLPIFGWAAITLGVGPYSSTFYFKSTLKTRLLFTFT